MVSCKWVQKSNHSPDGDFSVPVCSFLLKRQLMIFTCGRQEPLSHR